MISKEYRETKGIADFRATLDFLYNGEPQTVKPLLMIKETYKEWPAIYNWLCRNKLTGKKLVEFFQNESPDGGGVHMGVTHILSRLKGHKHSEVGIKGDELQ